jgi:FtsZ-binding cell division protein ZapB
MDQKSLEQLMSKLLDKKLDPVLKTLDNLQSKMDKIDQLEESINFLSKEYDDFIRKIKSLEEENSRLADENVCLKARPLNSHAFGVSLTQFASLSRSHATFSKSHAYSSFIVFFSII